MHQFFSSVGSYFVYSNIFITACAMLMLWETGYLFAIDLPYALYGFVFFGTLSSYSFHWGLTRGTSLSERGRWQQKHGMAHTLIFPFGLAGSAYFLIGLKEHLWPLAAAIFITFAYSAPKIPFAPFNKLRNKAIAKTFVLAFTWVYVCHILPFIFYENKFDAEVILYLLGKLFTIYAICMLFDIRDRDSDTKARIKSIASILNIGQAKVTYYMALALSTVGFGLLINYNRPALNIAALIIPNIVLAMMYKFVVEKNTDKVFYFFLDGMMPLSASILFVLNFIDK